MKDLSLAVLAGGKARRMGGQDKGLMPYRDKPLIEHVLDSVPAEINQRLIIANRHTKQYARWGHPVYSDIISGYLGPLAGIYTALSYAETPYVLCLPCDTPLLPSHLAEGLYQAMQTSNRQVCVAFDGERTHASCVLVAQSAKTTLAERLEQRQLRVQAWLGEINALAVDFSASKQAFVNINYLSEL